MCVMNSLFGTGSSCVDRRWCTEPRSVDDAPVVQVEEDVACWKEGVAVVVAEVAVDVNVASVSAIVEESLE